MGLLIQQSSVESTDEILNRLYDGAFLLLSL